METSKKNNTTLASAFVIGGASIPLLANTCNYLQYFVQNSGANLPIEPEKAVTALLNIAGLLLTSSLLQKTIADIKETKMRNERAHLELGTNDEATSFKNIINHLNVSNALNRGAIVTSIIGTLKTLMTYSNGSAEQIGYLVSFLTLIGVNASFHLESNFEKKYYEAKLLELKNKKTEFESKSKKLV